MSRPMDWNRVSVHVERGIRDDQPISEISGALREQGADRREIRTVISQVRAAKSWRATVRDWR